MKWNRVSKWVRKLLLPVSDAILLCAALCLAFLMRFESGADQTLNASYTFSRLFYIVGVYLAAFWVGGVYEILWNYAGSGEVIRLGGLCGAACLVLIAMDMAFAWSVSRGMLVMQAPIAIVLIGGSRLLWRIVANAAWLKDRSARGKMKPGPRLMIVGAGDAGAYLLNMCGSDPSLGRPILFVDDDPQKQKQRIHGVAVRGTTGDIPKLSVKYDIQEIVIAVPDLRGSALNALAEKCKETPCRVRILMQMQTPENAKTHPGMFVRELNISDFLSRDEVTLDTEGISEYLAGKRVLVTGGGGSIGAELCRQIMRFSPRALILFDIYENCAYELLCELRQRYGKECPVHVSIGSVRDAERLEEVFAQYRPEVVFHAAAHKHVPLMEDSPAEAIKNNVFGTLNTLETASRHHAERFVLLSTDKAVNPTNVMGATKRVAEMLIQYYAKKTEMKCMAVRFGNVLGSHGSVIPLFERQIRNGGPVTVTHPDVLRYFMTIPEAAQLVLQAGSLARTGSICVLDMGEPVRIDDLARRLIRFYGYEPGVNMDVVYTGLRPGEKLNEELFTENERSCMGRTAHERIMIAPVTLQNEAAFERRLIALRAAAEHNDAGAMDALAQIVPGYRGEQNNTDDAAVSCACGLTTGSV